MNESSECVWIRDTTNFSDDCFSTFYSDLWDLAARWGNAGDEGRNHPPRGPQPKWVQELMMETQRNADKSNEELIEGIGEQDEENQRVVASPVRALPRTPEQCGSALDSSEFWSTFELTPAVPWVD